jgi:N-acetylglucosamine-6-sulfatase
MRRGNAAALVAAFALVVAGISVGLGACSSSGSILAKLKPTVLDDRGVRPNVVVVQADDQTVAQFNRQVMSRTFKLLATKGTSFSDYIATTALCCPSRASLITGQYVHNHGVYANRGARGGYQALRDKQSVLPAWLQQSGYRTIHVGSKYLNGYREVAGTAVAPGWSDWFTVLSHTQYYDYTLSRDGHHRRRGDRPGDYISRVLGNEAKRLIDRHAPQQRPFYLQLDERAPHVSRTDDPRGRCDKKPVPDPRDEGALTNASLPDPPSFNQADMSDKPTFLRGVTPLHGPGKAHLLAKWRCALGSLVGVDRNVGKVHRAVKRSGELNRTVFVYVSDNGVFYGEHRLLQGKVLPYEEVIRAPLVMVVPNRYRDGAPRRSRINEPVGNIDLAPTILDLAHAQPCPATGECRTMDGRSLMPLLTGHGQWPQRRSMLSEYWAFASSHYSTCKFAAVRTPHTMYAEHYVVPDSTEHGCTTANPPEVERYNLSRDPYELRNLCAGGRASNCPHDPSQKRLKAQLRRLRDCAGIEGRDERVDGRPFCS